MGDHSTSSATNDEQSAFVSDITNSSKVGPTNFNASHTQTSKPLQQNKPLISTHEGPTCTHSKMLLSFQDLPTEMRFMIWDSCIESRVVEVRLEPRWSSKGNYDFVTTPHNPVVVHINQESRHRYLKKYLNIGSRDSLNSVYFHPEFDILYLRDGGITARNIVERTVGRLPHKNRIQNLACHSRFITGDPNILGNPHSNDLPLIFKFPSLKRFFNASHFSDYHNDCFDRGKSYDYSKSLTLKQKAFGKQLYFGNALAKNRTYFANLGQSSYSGISENSDLSRRMVSRFLQAQVHNGWITCQQVWDRMLTEVATTSSLGELWCTVVPQPVEFFDLLVFDEHIPDEEYSHQFSTPVKWNSNRICQGRPWLFGVGSLDLV